MKIFTVKSTHENLINDDEAIRNEVEEFMNKYQQQLNNDNNITLQNDLEVKNIEIDRLQTVIAQLHETQIKSVSLETELEDLKLEMNYLKDALSLKLK